MKKFFLFSLFASFTVLQVVGQEPAEQIDPVFGTSLPTNRDPFAQPARTRTSAPPPSGTTPIKDPATDPSSGIQNNPIDGGLTALLLTGALYGAKRYRRTQKKHSL